MSLFDNYSPSDMDEEMFLSKVPIDILKNAIRNQFRVPYEFRKRNYIQTYREKYENTQVYGEELDIIEGDEIHRDFIDFMEGIFDEYLGIGFDCIEDKSAEEQLYMLEMTCLFFIRLIRKNFTNLIVNYINRYPDICEGLQERRDVTYYNYKNEGISLEDIRILSNLHYIVTTVMEKDFDVDEFFDLCAPNGYSLEYDYVKRQFDEFNITGNFVSHYVEMADDEDFISTLESKVKNRILKKYPDRKVVIPQEDEEEESPEENPVKARKNKEK